MLGKNLVNLPNPYTQNYRFPSHRPQLMARNPGHRAPPSGLVGSNPYHSPQLRACNPAHHRALYSAIVGSNPYHRPQLIPRNPGHKAPPCESISSIPQNRGTEKDMDAAIQQRASNPKAIASSFSTTNKKPEWKRLSAVCVEAQGNLEVSWSDLEKNVVKAYLFKADKVTIQRHIEAGLHQVKIIYKITQALCEKDTAENQCQLKSALKELERIKLAATPQPIKQRQTPATHGAVACFLKELHGFLAPVALMGWGLIAQSGLVSHITVQHMAFISGAISIIWTIATYFKNRAEQANTEDQLKLIQVCNSLMENFMDIGMLHNLPQRTEHVVVQRNGNFAEFVTVATNLEAEVNALHEYVGLVTESSTQKLSVLERELNQKIDNVARAQERMEVKLNRIVSEQIVKLENDMTEVKANLGLILTLLQNKAQ